MILGILCKLVMEEACAEIAEFNPAKHGLQDSFCLTDYASLKG